ncbi:MAG: helix-turn-helix domain-containing protein [Rothia sp. (in: high G+C Gram-positive bacteria)]|uniref:winged helix-turn-helix transcriptional regulator n=1 Tax=Rothia sp. (in: high G+C Gram-positive bacteria) TaxID=1885016 RepID=UPI00270A33EC|nr:helix-turn-helix domain-containing protein [Rothia sp. (in: high G+C Gram-positive bacteria)]
MPSSPQVSADVRPTSLPAAEQLPADVLSQHCPSRIVLRHLTDRWTPLIVAVLADGEPVRFKDLKSTIQGISPKVLTETLRSMERDGLLTRHITASVPPRVDYQLTNLGLTTVEPLEAVRTWAETHVAEVLANRERFDAAQPL